MLPVPCIIGTVRCFDGSSQDKVSSVTVVRRLSSNSRKNQIYKAFWEIGHVMRTAALLRFLADSRLRAPVTAAPTRPGHTTGSPPGPRFGNQGVIAENDPAEQESRSNGTRYCAT